MTTSIENPSISSALADEEKLHDLKIFFEHGLKEKLNLKKVSAPIALLKGTGINDDLSGIERPVSFPIKDLQEQPAEIVHSLAKWKRLRLRKYGIPPGTGIVTDMKALRPDEVLGPLHSIYVDQWDWEKCISKEQRHLDFLKQQVRSIYQAILKSEEYITAQHNWIATLPPEIRFIHTEQLLAEYPALTAKEREDEAAKKHGAFFLIGIGGVLADGEPHDGRAPDYDDWSTPTSETTTGLNGDIILWSPVLNRSVEISSMGIRVDAEALYRQLKICGAEARSILPFHQDLLQGNLPLSIGGGIGQSRLAMFLLRKQHIGQVQVSIWPEELVRKAESEGIYLL